MEIFMCTYIQYIYRYTYICENMQKKNNNKTKIIDYYIIYVKRLTEI